MEAPANKLHHNFKSEMVIPISAVENNINVNIGSKVLTADNVECIIDKMEYINMLSKYASDIIFRLYKQHPYTFMQMWDNSTIPISSIHFLYLHLKRTPTKE